MDVPFFTVCKADPTVQSLLGGALPRIYPFGQAPQTVVKPYVVYQQIAGSPFNLLGNRPEADSLVFQVDVYATTSQSSTAVARAIRYAIEENCYVLSYRGDTRDETTMLYRTSFDVDWIVFRD